MTRPKRIEIVEVGPRDGLQNEVQHLSPSERITLIEQLSDAGLVQIEAGAFVSTRWVPQMAGSDEILTALNSRSDLRLPVLVPNLTATTTPAQPGQKRLPFLAPPPRLSHKRISTVASLQVWIDLPKFVSMPLMMAFTFGVISLVSWGAPMKARSTPLKSHNGSTFNRNGMLRGFPW